jgi:quercetin dioxygenase-like cupin family protein
MRAPLALVVAACSQPAKPVHQEAPAQANVVAADAAGPSQEEKLAAIQKAMNELDEASQGCWAMAATDRFDIEGELTMMVEIGNATAKASVVNDTARNAKLSGCLVQLLGGYRWAPPLVGETIELPFKFAAPDGQSVIDRKLVEWHGQQSTSVAVLLDENNTGNGAASMLEVAIAPRGSTGMRVAERSELWYFLGEVEVKSRMTQSKTGQLDMTALAGQMMFVPKGTAREVIARRPDVHAVVVLVPGGREGSARAGALPTAVGESGASLPVPLFGKPIGSETEKLMPASANVVELAANQKLAENTPAGATEMLYVLGGSGTLSIAGQDVAVTPTSVVQIPPNTQRAFTASTSFRALQLIIKKTP